MQQQRQQRLPGLGFAIADAAGNAPAQGLYRPEFDHDSCGVGFIARLDNDPHHDVVAQAVTLLVNMEHRGALGGDGKTGDGAGMLMQIPHRFLLDQGLRLPDAGTYGVGMLFLPTAKKANR